MKRVLVPLIVASVAWWSVPATTAAAASSCVDPPPSLDERLGVSTVSGGLVMDVVPGSPAETAGFALLDLVVSSNELDMQDASSLEQFTSAMREAAMLEQANLLVWKYDAVTKQHIPTRITLRLPAVVGSKAGLMLVKQQLVTEVLPGRIAESAGVQVGDFIYSVADKLLSVARTSLEIDQVLDRAATGGTPVQIIVGRWELVENPAEGTTAFSPTREVMFPL